MDLDAGCGSSKREGSIGVDIQKFEGLHVQCSVEALPFQEKVFETCYLTEVLEHLHSPWRGLKEIRRVANHLRLSIPNPHYVGRLLRRLLNKKCEVSSEHISLWGRAEIFNLLNLAGFYPSRVYFEDTHFHESVFSFLPGYLKCHSMVVRC